MEIRNTDIILEIPQFARDFPKSCSNFAQKRSKVAPKKTENILLLSSFTWFGNCTTKVRILSIFMQFCGETGLRISINVVKILHLRHSNQLSHFLLVECKYSSTDLAAPLHAYCTHHLPEGERGIWLLAHRKFINCPLKHCEIWST